MSRTTLKSDLIKNLEGRKTELFNKVNSKGFYSEKDERKLAVFQRLVLIDSLLRYLNSTKYDMFQAIERQDKIQTIWSVDDEAIGIIEEDLDYFVNALLNSMYDFQLADAESSLSCDVIVQEHVSVVQRCLYEKKHGNN